MTINMSFSPGVDELASATDGFIRQYVLPIEDEFGGDIELAGGDLVRRRMQDAGREAGVFGPHIPTEFGGAGLSMCDRAPIFEQAGYSVFGPLALNINAPDEGNVHLLDHIATGAQREQFLDPLARGLVRSAFAMSEPPPGAGSDPAALSTRAEKVAGGWKLRGRKRFITGADGADFLIVMARTSGAPGDRGGATMFLTPVAARGLTIGRHTGMLDRATLGGHCDVLFDDVFVPGENVLGSVDQGFANAQIRLGPARMTHVMRWLGTARRAHDVALGYVSQREGFGHRLGELGMVQQMLADNEIDLAATRALLLVACFELDAGLPSAHTTSITKTFAAEAIHRVVDRCMQVCGGSGLSADLPLARLAAEVRGFRIYDGPSEVHRWAIAKRALRSVRRH
jgi:acyl-CoA dehydrogenase